MHGLRVEVEGLGPKMIGVEGIGWDHVDLDRFVAEGYALEDQLAATVHGDDGATLDRAELRAWTRIGDDFMRNTRFYLSNVAAGLETPPGQRP